MTCRRKLVSAGSTAAAAPAFGKVGVDGVEIRLDVRVAGKAAHDAARA
jgi:hypothetical protein